jgi:hypothetical protein
MKQIDTLDLLLINTPQNKGSIKIGQSSSRNQKV